MPSHDTDAPLCRDQTDWSYAMPAGGWWRELEPRLNNRSPTGNRNCQGGSERLVSTNRIRPGRSIGSGLAGVPDYAASPVT